MPDPIVVPRLTRRRGPAARSTTWWGRAFVRSVEETTLEGDALTASRSLAGSGRLSALVVLESMASAVVDPGTSTSVMPQVKIAKLDAASWRAFAQEVARENGFVTALETGELPAELVEHADEAGVELMPGPGAIDTACECEAWIQPCVHALALLHQLAWAIDRDPYVLMLLRGRTREALLEDVATSVSSRDERGAAELEDARVRAAQVLALAREAPPGHGLADTAVASYDEQVSRLL